MKKVLLLSLCMMFCNFSYSNLHEENVAQIHMSSMTLLNICKKEDSDAASKYLCNYYLAGVIDTLFTTHFSEHINTQCYQKSYPGVSISQITKMFIKYLDENPKMLHYSPPDIIVRVYVENFPPKACWEKSKPIE